MDEILRHLYVVFEWLRSVEGANFDAVLKELQREQQAQNFQPPVKPARLLSTFSRLFSIQRSIITGPLSSDNKTPLRA